jgi:hypothetical protein
VKEHWWRREEKKIKSGNNRKSNQPLTGELFLRCKSKLQTNKRVPFSSTLPASWDILSMAAAADFAFLDFPFEIRKHVYASMLEGQMVHCCPDEQHVHHDLADTGKTPQANFSAGIMQCSSTCYESLSLEVRNLTQEVKWTNRTPDRHLPSPSDVLSFLLSCKTVWHEMEPLIWRYVTFCIGLPQFAGFYERFLARKRPSHPTTRPRASLMQRLSLALVQDITLANSLGNDARLRSLSGFWLIRCAKRESISYLKEQCIGLQHLLATVDGNAFTESLGAGGMVIPFEDSLALLQFRRLKTFSLMVDGPVDHINNTLDYHSTPAAHPKRLAVDGTESILREILTRKEEPLSGSDPPEGISSTDPDYVWLKDYYERGADGDPRLTELVLKTRLYLEKRGITTPLVSDSNF